MFLDLIPRPLDPVRSFKVKVGLLVTGSLAMSVLVFWFLASWQWRYALLAALVAALALTQILAHGMTSPLREMTKAARAMSDGDYSIRVRATSRDEIGELAQAFNKMSADLDGADQNRRELIANVSHELRTPISALHAVLENIVDGVAPADPAAMRAALAQTERLGQLVRDLLDLSRIEGGATALRPAEFAVADFVRRGGAACGAVVAQRAHDRRRASADAHCGRGHGTAAPGDGESAGQRRAAQPTGRHRHRPRPA